MNKKLKKIIQHNHLVFDSLMGRLFSRQGTLGKKALNHRRPLLQKHFNHFTYSKKSHFNDFSPLPIHQTQSPATCDLKVYQDSLVHTFILDTLKPGARLLEIGGGESRIISKLKNEYECWNLDKLEGEGHGPKSLIKDEGFYLIQDYIGDFSKKIPDQYFDLVFSISTIEHIPNTTEVIKNILDDIQRLLKPGGYSLHCVDAFLHQDQYSVHELVKTVYENNLVEQTMPDFSLISKDKDLWCLPGFAFYTRWYHLVKQPLNRFGYPFSMNILWKK